MLTDTHCHLTIEDSEDDVSNIISRATEYGVNRMITIGSDLKSSFDAVVLAKKYSEVWATVGIHPEESMELELEEIENKIWKIEELLERNDGEIVAVGEIGIDRNWIEYQIREKGIEDAEGFSKDSLIKQSHAFQLQLELALKYKLPAVVHCRRGEEDSYSLLSAFHNKGGIGVLHSFTGSIDFMKYFVEKGWYVSFNGIITFKNGENVRELLSFVPIEQILVETDSPFLSPEPERGKRNEPAKVAIVAKKVAELKGLNYEEFCDIHERNVKKLFRL